MSKRKLFVSTLRRWGFLTGLVALFLIAVGVVYCTYEFRSFTRWVAHTNDVLDTLNRLEILVERAEGSQRGYLITKKAKMLQPYHSALEHVREDLTFLEKLVKDNPEQDARSERLAATVDLRFQRLQKTLALSETTSLLELAPRLDTDTIVEIRHIIEDMENAENALLEEREKRADFFARLTVILLLGGGALAVGVLAFSAYFSRRYQRELKEHSNLTESILSNLSEGLIVVNPDARVIHRNGAAEQMLESNLMGLSLQEMFESIQATNPENKQRRSYKEAALYRAIHGETIERFETRVGKNGDRL